MDFSILYILFYRFPYKFPGGEIPPSTFVIQQMHTEGHDLLKDFIILYIPGGKPPRYIKYGEILKQIMPLRVHLLFLVQSGMISLKISLPNPIILCSILALTLGASPYSSQRH